MTQYAWVAFGAAMGGVARFLISGLVQRGVGREFPFGTLAVNVVGCVVIGAVIGLSESRGGLSPDVRALVVTGILGGFTTFSAFGYETVALLEEGAAGLAVANVVVSVSAGLAAVVAGRAVGAMFGP